ncbi:MAG: D-aminoacyl-tRNA deacylase [Chloroflexota bacterium]
MRVILQRVSKGSVSVDGEVVGTIGQGYVALVGVTHGDTEADAEKLAKKTAELRVFEDEAGKMNISAADVAGGVLVISQFTLYADTRRGRRPGFSDAARPDVASPLVDYYAQQLRTNGIRQVETGVFGANMQVEIHNDGPVTIILDTADWA